MSRTALARAYRPRRFSEVATQEHVSATLRTAVQRDRVAHAYLFCGPRGVGKTTLARVLAMALNCPERGDDGEPCGVCDSCQRIWAGRTSLDVVEIDAASNRGVDDARDLRERAMYAPSEHDRYKIYIIDEAHMLTREAWNALLKILEEPPPRVIFVFATTEPQKIQQAAPPILSRCQRFDFHRIGTADLVARMRTVLAAEKVDASEAVLLPIAQKADGGMRDALSLLDQVLSFTEGDPTSADVRRVLGLVEDELYLELADIVAGQRLEAVFDFVGRLMARGYDLAEFYRGLADFLRALLVIKLDGATAEIRADLRESYEAAAAQFAAGDLLRMLSQVAELDADGRFRKSGQQQILIELLILRFAFLDRTVSIEDVLGAISGNPPPAGGGGARPERPAPQRAPAPGAESRAGGGQSAAAPVVDGRASASAGLPSAAPAPHAPAGAPSPHSSASAPNAPASGAAPDAPASAPTPDARASASAPDASTWGGAPDTPASAPTPHSVSPAVPASGDRAPAAPPPSEAAAAEADGQPAAAAHSVGDATTAQAPDAQGPAAPAHAPASPEASPDPSAAGEPGVGRQADPSLKTPASDAHSDSQEATKRKHPSRPEGAPSVEADDDPWSTHEALLASATRQESGYAQEPPQAAEKASGPTAAEGQALARERAGSSAGSSGSGGSPDIAGLVGSAVDLVADALSDAVRGLPSADEPKGTRLTAGSGESTSSGADHQGSGAGDSRTERRRDLQLVPSSEPPRTDTRDREAPMPAPSREPIPLQLAAVRRAWKAMLEEGDLVPARMKVILRGCDVSLGGAGKVRVTLPPGSPPPEEFADARSRQRFQEWLTERIGAPTSIEFVTADAASMEPSRRRITADGARQEKLRRLTAEEPLLDAAVKEWDLELLD